MPHGRREGHRHPGGQPLVLNGNRRLVDGTACRRYSHSMVPGGLPEMS